MKDGDGEGVRKGGTGEAGAVVWQRFLDTATGHYYFINAETGESSWTKPEGGY